MLRRRIGHTSMSRYAWMAPALVLLAFIVIFLFGNDSSDQTGMQEKTADYERVRLDSPTTSEDLQSSGALSDDRRQTVLQRLSTFRADYRVISPTVTVTGVEGAGDAAGLAQRIGTLLAQSSLGSYAPDAGRTGSIGSTTEGGEQDSMIVFVRGEDRTMAHALTAALSPMLSGTVRIQFDDALRSGDLLLLIAAPPRYTAQGIAVFTQQ